MELQQLTATGLTHLQASAYALLIELGEVRPPDLVKKLKLTRTNAYKILDKLAELQLAVKVEQNKKFVYQPANPTALANLAAGYRSEATAREEAVNAIMHNLLDKYHAHSDKPGVTIAIGSKEVAKAYRLQLNLREDIHFVHTPADVAMMGFETMSELRTTPARTGNSREGILFADGWPGATINHEMHKRSNLTPTYADAKDYTSPVEWSVTKSSLLIVTFTSEPQAVLIMDTVIATAFLQLYTILQNLLRLQPAHEALREKA